MYILKLGFYDDFHCIGGECILTCCQGWKITVEKSVYQKYMEYSGELVELTKLQYGRSAGIYPVVVDKKH